LNRKTAAETCGMEPSGPLRTGCIVTTPAGLVGAFAISKSPGSWIKTPRRGSKAELAELVEAGPETCGATVSCVGGGVDLPRRIAPALRCRITRAFRFGKGPLAKLGYRKTVGKAPPPKG